MFCSVRSIPMYVYFEIRNHVIGGLVSSLLGVWFVRHLLDSKLWTFIFLREKSRSRLEVETGSWLYYGLLGLPYTPGGHHVCDGFFLLFHPFARSAKFTLDKIMHDSNLWKVLVTVTDRIDHLYFHICVLAARQAKKSGQTRSKIRGGCR